MLSLFVYGTLGPGRPNAHVLERIGGTWQEGFVRGNLLNKGWGAEMGYPGIRLNHNGEQVNGFIFTSENLANHWEALDKFEGEGYERVPVEVMTREGSVVLASVYAVKA
ncbi:gamma-glutamylcyclotransferase family protein (plasmid) [Pantoea sp. C3]|uniref:gamma-glutamylcyclotransferase family protein n=1 Tax=Pantoea phytostimulans TaxID=2769024 RepID=UPI0038F7CE50